MHVRAGEYWRIASYMILHIGWGHLLLNTWAGVSWSASVERALGQWRFLLVYILAGLGGGAACAAFSNAVTAGASGAMFGIIGSLLAIRYRTLGSFQAFSSDSGVRATFGQIVIWTVLGVVALPMSQSAHFGGFFTGGIATLILMYPRQHRTTAWVVFGVAFAVLLLAATRPWERWIVGERAKQAAGVDLANVKIGRMGQPKDNEPIALLAAKSACERGIERGCVIDGIATMDPEDEARCIGSYPVFAKACTNGDADACAAQGMLVGMGCGLPANPERSQELLRRACDAGSEYGCELVF